MLWATPPPSRDHIPSLLPSWVHQEGILRCSESRVEDMNLLVGSHSKPPLCSLAQKMQTDKMKTSMASLWTWFLLLCLLSFDKHDMQLGKSHFHKCFILPPPSTASLEHELWPAWPASIFPQAHPFSFAVTVVPRAELPGWKELSIGTHRQLLCLPPNPLPESLPAGNLCSFLKAKMNGGLLSFPLGCRHREIPVLLTYPT